MRILGVLSPRSGVGKTTLVLNLGWVFADAGLRVVLLDLDPQAGLTELAGASMGGPGSIYDALAPLADGGELGEVAPVVLTPNHLLHGVLPAALDSLSSHTTVDEIADVEPDRIEIQTGGLRVRGTASIGARLEWGGGERRDGTETSMSFPLRFDVDLDRSHQDVVAVHVLEVDTSSFYE